MSARKRHLVGGAATNRNTGTEPITETRPAHLVTADDRDGGVPGGHRVVGGVAAVRTTPGPTGSWAVKAFAICADPVPGTRYCAATRTPTRPTRCRPPTRRGPTARTSWASAP